MCVCVCVCVYLYGPIYKQPHMIDLSLECGRSKVVIYL